MSTTIEQALTPHIGKAMRITRGDELENIQFINFSTLSEEDQADIYEYYLEGDLAKSVESGKMVPIAMLGLSDCTDSYAEMNHGGLLLWDLRDNTSKKEIFYYNNNTAEFTSAAESFDALPIKSADAERTTTVEEDELAQLQSPEHREDWEKVGELYRQGNLAEALALCEQLNNRLIPTGNSRLMQMMAVLLIELSRIDEGLAIAEDLLIFSFRSGPALEFSGRMLLKAQEYERALATADELLSWLGDDDNKKLRAAAYAIRGLSQHHLGNTEEGIRNITEAKSLHLMITLKYPEIRKILG